MKGFGREVISGVRGDYPHITMKGISMRKGEEE
jgi:hypothetical protein